MRIFLAFLFTIYSCAPAQAAFVREATSTPGLNYQRNFVKNPEADKNIGNITVSSAIITRSTTTPLQAPADFSIDATATAQTVKFDTFTLDNSLKGQNCEAKFVFTGDATLYKAYVEQGSTKVTTDLTLTNETNSRAVSINFPCGDLTSNSHLVIESTGNGAAIKVDQVYTGLATNLSNVAQAQFIGSAYYPTTASCVWSRTSATMGAFGSTAACPAPTIELNPGPGVISTTDANLPQLTVTNLPAGQYRISVSLSAYNNATGSTSNLSVSDGTTTSGQCIVSGAAAAEAYTCQIEANFSYTSDQATKTFEIYGASTATTINIHNSNSLAKTRMGIYRYPSSSEIALNSSNTPWYVDATMDGANPSLGVANVTSYTEIIDAGLTLKPQTGSSAVGVMCSTTNAATAPSTGNTTCAAGSESLGINFEIPKAGSYEVCFYGAHDTIVDSGEQLFSTFQLIETPTNAQTLTLEGGTRHISGHSGMTIATGTASEVADAMTNCSVFSWASSGPKGVRLMFEQAIAGAPNASTIFGDANTSVGQRNMRWTVKPITNQIPAPILVGSVTSNSSGMERVERARINCDGASESPPSNQSGSWITAVGNIASGACAITVASGIFSAAPTCTATVQSIASGYAITAFATASSATSLSVGCRYLVSGSSTISDCAANDFNITCQGPR